MDNTDNRKAKMLVALEEAHGIVTTACKNADVARSTFYQWCEMDKDFKAAVDSINDTAIDFVESKLFQKINGVTIGKPDGEGNIVTYEVPPSDTAIIFYLKTKAKSRGYVERQEVDHTTKGEALTGFVYVVPQVSQ